MPRLLARRGLAGARAAAAAGLWAAVPAAGETVFQQESPIVWLILAISVAGAIVTFAFLVYALWRFRDPATGGRRYG